MTYRILSRGLAVLFVFSMSPLSQATGREPVVRAGTEVSNSVFKWVEGREPAPVPMSIWETGTALRDPFGQGLVTASDRVPGTVEDVLGLLDGFRGTAQAVDDQTVYVMSEAGQIPLAQAPDLERRARAVVVRRDKTGKSVIFIAPSTRDGGALEVMSWDGIKGAFNFYERSTVPEAAGNGRPIWIFRGDSRDALDDSSRNSGCFRCHRNGEPVMKELRVPWQNWHSQSATIKPEAIAPDSPLATNPLFSIAPSNKYLRNADQLEPVIRQWITPVNRARISLWQRGGLSARKLLEPMFRTTTMNLITSPQASESSQAVQIPWTVFYDVAGLGDAAELDCNETLAFGGRPPTIARSAYQEGLKALRFRLESQPSYLKSPGDTFFALPTPERAFTDTDLMTGIANAGIVSRPFLASLLLIDVQNPVYSRRREALFAHVPDWRIANVPAIGLEKALADRFRELAASSPTGEAGRAAVEFLALWDGQKATWEKRACAKLESYMGAVGKRWNANNANDFMELIVARRDRFLRSDHGLLRESELLFPRADGRDVELRLDGTIGVTAAP